MWLFTYDEQEVGLESSRYKSETATAGAFKYSTQPPEAWVSYLFITIAH